MIFKLYYYSYYYITTTTIALATASMMMNISISAVILGNILLLLVLGTNEIPVKCSRKPREFLQDWGKLVAGNQSENAYLVRALSDALKDEAFVPWNATTLQELECIIHPELLGFGLKGHVRLISSTVPSTTKTMFFVGYL